MTTNVNDRDSVVSSHSAITSTSVNPASTYLEERANGFPDPLATPSQPVPGVRIFSFVFHFMIENSKVVFKIEYH